MSTFIYGSFFHNGYHGYCSVNAKEDVVDFEKLTSVLERCFGRTWHIFLRLHHQLEAQKLKVVNPTLLGRLIDVTAMA